MKMVKALWPLIGVLSFLAMLPATASEASVAKLNERITMLTDQFEN